jgi:hypothetical protein
MEKIRYKIKKIWCKIKKHNHKGYWSDGSPIISFDNIGDENE